MSGVLVASLYLPNGNPLPGSKFEYRGLVRTLITHAADLVASGAPVVLAGDFNVVPTEADIYQPHHWREDALLHPQVFCAKLRILRPLQKHDVQGDAVTSRSARRLDCRTQCG